MIRSFNDKLKAKQVVYEAEQLVLQENARIKQVQAEWEAVEQEHADEQHRVNQILLEEQERRELKFLKEKRILEKAAYHG